MTETTGTAGPGRGWRGRPWRASQQQLAGMADASRQAVSAVEAGHSISLRLCSPSPRRSA